MSKEEKLRQIRSGSYKRDKRLEGLYAKYNKLYFDGVLPSNVPVGWGDGLTSTDAIGVTLTITDDTTKHTLFVVYIDPAIKQYTTITKMTLLHEMSHIKVHPYTAHGKKFDEEMLRLASRGAFNGLW